jgi:hypothetical protein
VSPGDLGDDFFQDDVAILNEVRERGNAAAGSVTPVIGNDQVQSLLVIERSDFIIITHHFAIAVEEKDPGPFLMALVKSAGDGSLVPNGNGEVKAIARARGKILSGIKDESEDGGLVERRIVDHEFNAPSLTKPFARRRDRI